MRIPATIALVLTIAFTTAAQAALPVYLWYEPEWFEGVSGSFGYWSGFDSSKPKGSWGIAGPGIAAEFTQGGESEWNSMGVPAAETSATAQRNITIPRAGKYRVWVRYYDHRDLTEPFTIRVEQSGKTVAGELGVKPIVPRNDEYQLYWGFSFGWGSVDGQLDAGPATLKVVVDKAGQAFRQVDAVLITDDLDYVPQVREKPPFNYFSAFRIHPGDGKAWRGQMSEAGDSWKRPALGGRDFSMWVTGASDAKASPNLAQQSLLDYYYDAAIPRDLTAQFPKQFPDKQKTPLVNWPGYFPGLYLGVTPDLSPGSPIRTFLERTKAPFYIMTNYANPQYTDQTGPATYQALTGVFKDQFLGYIHGEATGSLTVHPSGISPQGKTRKQFIDAFIADLKKQQEAEWSKFYKTPVPADHWDKGIACMSCETIALAHAMLESGRQICAYELDATNDSANQRIAFMRGAARQYGKNWINYASGNFGDSCNYFSQEPVVPRGAPSWFHSRYAITDGVDIGWYRKLYYLNFMGGASAIYWEQGLHNQWIKPGPGEHPVQLSPFGRATEDFQDFVTRVGDRGEPYTPVAVLLSYGHGYERVSNSCKVFDVYTEGANDLELRELFGVLWFPEPIRASAPITPEKQSLQPSVFGDIFDILVDRPNRLDALKNYPIVIAAGDADLTGATGKAVLDHVKNGATLVVNASTLRRDANGKVKMDDYGLTLLGSRATFTAWSPDGKESLEATPFEVENVELHGAKPIIWADAQTPIAVRQKVGKGAIIVTLVPHMIGMDERAHPALPYLMRTLTSGLMPVEVLTPDGDPSDGRVMFSINRTKSGYLVSLYNNEGIDKTQNGIARVDRTKVANVLIRTREDVKTAKELTQPHDLTLEKDGDARLLRLSIPAGEIAVISLTK